MEYKKEVLFFEYFFFEPLGHNDLARYIQEHPRDFDTQTIGEFYNGWMMSYRHKSQLFYQSQYRKHQDLTWFSFCQHYKLPDYENPDNLGLDYEWTDWKENYRLDKHFEQYKIIVEEFSESNDSKQSLSNSKINNSLYDEAVIYKEIDGVWFNRLISNLPEITAKLRSLPYEKYLETSHWKKIRAAMVLINTATCQAEECSVVGESWYGGNESDLQIHHLDYANRGNERFKDLAVVCKRHHELIHQNLKEFGDPRVIIL